MAVRYSIKIVVRGVSLAAAGMVLAVVAPAGRTADVLDEALFGGGVPSYGDSGDFDIDAGLTFGEPGYADSPDFGVDTSLQSNYTLPAYGTSGFFAVNTSLQSNYALPAYGTSGNMAMDTRRVNRTWADSATFAYDNPLGCVGSYAGNYFGGSFGTVQASLGCDNSLSITFVSALGPVLFSGVGTVQADGTVSGGAQGVTFGGTFNLTQCTASGTWQYGGVFSGSWNLMRTAAGSCTPSVLFVAPSGGLHPGQGSGVGILAVVNTGAGSMPYSVAVTQGGSWMRITSGATGVNGGLVWTAFDANPNPGPRTGVIRVTAPGATPGFVDVAVTQAGSAPPATVTHFEFDPIVGPYMVGDSIPVTVRAVNASVKGNTMGIGSTFNGNVNLSTNAPCRLSRNSLTLQNGVGSGAVQCDQSFVGVKLKAFTSLDVFGESNAFTINSPDALTGCIDGRVDAESTGSPAGATVDIYDAQGTLVASVPAQPIAPINPLGFYRYRACGLAPSTYEIRASNGTFVSRRKKLVVVAGKTRSGDLTLLDTAKPVVLLVGGFMGSTLDTSHLRYPEMGEVECPDRSKLKLYDPPVCFSGALVGLGRGDAPIWGALKTALGPHFTIIEVPWDWRKSIKERTCSDDSGAPVDVLEKYLIPAIDEAKELHDAKVYVVAHSLGGILVRHYIQGPRYRGDIDYFTLCGTPNRGSPLAYYVWAAGDTVTPDSFQNGIVWGLSPEERCSPNDFYTNTFNNTYQGICSAIHCPASVEKVTEVQKRDFVQAYLRGVADMLPIYPVLRSSTSLQYQELSLSQQSILRDLAASSSVSPLVGACDGNSAKVRTSLFMAESEETVSHLVLNVNAISLDASLDAVRGLGDGTVPALSARGHVSAHDSLQARITVIDDAESGHSRLMHKYANEILRFLQGQLCPMSERPESPEGTLALTTQEPVAILTVNVYGRTQLHLMDPNGLVTGIDLVSGVASENIPESLLNVDHDSTGIRIFDPTNGDYTLSLTAFPDEVFSVEVSYADANGIQSARTSGIYHSGVISVDVTIDSTALPPPPVIGLQPTRKSQRPGRVAVASALTVQGPIDPPTNIRTSNVNGLARIEWDASSDPAATGYNVYGRPDDQPKFTLLGSTSGTFFDTNHAWVSQGVGALWNYFVVAAAGDGTESLFNTVVENRSPLIARMFAKVTTGTEPLTVNFMDASAGEVTAWAWDFESDGVIDSSEQNPIHQFTAPGSYTVSLTVGGPEGTDTSVRVGFVTVDPLVPPPPVMPGDFNDDHVVDLADFSSFVDYLLGPFEDPQLAGWDHFDFEGDYDVDLQDFATFQRVFLTAP